MTNAAPTLSSHLPPADLPSDFAMRALVGLRRFRIRRLHRLLALILVGVAVGVVYAAVSWHELHEEVASSSFVPLVHLAISDPDVVSASGGDYILGVLENLPFAALITTLVFIFLAIGAAAALFKIRTMRRPPFSNHPPVVR